eukprot:5292377-Alexandrium_andersonii.AAC.1
MAQMPTSAELQTSHSGSGPSTHHVLPGNPGSSSAANPADFAASPAMPKTSAIPPKYMPAAKYPNFKPSMPDTSKMKCVNAMHLEPKASPAPSTP